MKRIILLVLAAAFAAVGSAVFAQSGENLLPAKMEGWWTQDHYSGKIAIAISDQSNAKDIKGAITRQAGCYLRAEPFASASLEGNMFTATVPLARECSRNTPVMYKEGSPLTLTITLSRGPNGKVTGTGRTVNDAPVGQTITAVQMEEVR